MKYKLKRVYSILVATLLLGTPGLSTANADKTAYENKVFATVNNEIISTQTYLSAVRAGGRQRFYHGKAPEQEIIDFRQEVGEKLVDERLLHQEAIRRNISPDSNWVNSEFEKIERQYSSSPQWAEGGDELTNELISRLEERSRINQMDALLSIVQEPTEDELLVYYKSSPETFTSPEQFKVSTILLPVEPWQPKNVWDTTTQNAESIHEKLLSGVDFDSFAAEYSPKANQQPDYIHRGMLGESAQEAIDKLQPGQFTDVVRLLEGIAIFRLDDKITAKLNPLDVVRERAIALWKRDRTESTREAAIQLLRDAADIQLDESNYQLVSTGATKKTDSKTN